MGPQVKDPALSLPWVTALAQVQSSAPGHTSRCPRPGREGGGEGGRQNCSPFLLFLGGGEWVAHRQHMEAPGPGVKPYLPSSLKATVFMHSLNRLASLKYHFFTGARCPADQGSGLLPRWRHGCAAEECVGETCLNQISINPYYSSPLYPIARGIKCPEFL